jgi:hypothetical protein
MGSGFMTELLEMPGLIASTAAASHTCTTRRTLFAAVDVLGKSCILPVTLKRHFRPRQRSFFPGLHWLYRGTAANTKKHCGNGEHTQDIQLVSLHLLFSRAA